MVLSAAIAVGSVWAGLVISNVVPAVPPSFAIVAVVSVAYAAALVGTRRRSTTVDDSGSSAARQVDAGRPR
jgi:zinc/manganese transport system permease protein